MEDMKSFDVEQSFGICTNHGVPCDNVAVRHVVEDRTGVMQCAIAVVHTQEEVANEGIIGELGCEDVGMDVFAMGQACAILQEINDILAVRWVMKSGKRELGSVDARAL